MRRGGPNVNFAIYGKALVHLVRHPSILLLPLAAAAIDLFIWYWGTLFTDPLGGIGTGLFALVVQIIYLFAFGGAVVQANNIARGYRTSFGDAWDETRRKSGGILLAAIGFQFVTWFAAYVGAFLGGGNVQLLLQLIAYFFLILTIPAAAIGGLPAQLALSGSIRAVRANTLGCIVLAVVFVALWVLIPRYGLLPLVGPYGVLVLKAAWCLYNAVALAYLAFPFAVTYDETAFRGY
jgi:hypothetical protein